MTQAHDLLIYTFGRHDAQWALRDQQGDLFRCPLTDHDWHHPTWRKLCEDPGLLTKFSPEAWYGIPERPSPREKSPGQVEAVGFPILVRTMAVWLDQRQNLPESDRLSAYLLLIATDRGRFRGLAEKLPANQAEPYRQLEHHLAREPVWCHHLWALHRQTILGWFKQSQRRTIHGDACLALGKIGFLNLEMVQQDLNWLDFNRRDTLFPLLEHAFLTEKGPNLALAIGSEPSEHYTGLLLDRCRQLTFVASTGMPVLNQALQATIRHRLAMTGPGRDIQVLDQPELRGQNETARPFSRQHADVAYENILELRRTLWAFYDAWEFQAASIYLATLPPSLAGLSTLAPHHQLINWTEGLLNHCHEAETVLPGLLHGTDLTMETMRHPVVRLQQRIFHGLHQHNFLDVFIALLTLRDVVAHRVLNDMVPGLVGENGMIDPKIYAGMGCSKKPGKPFFIRTIRIKAIQKAVNQNAVKKNKASWLLSFYESFEPIRKARNTVVHRGQLREADIQTLLLWLVDNRPNEAGNLEQSLPIVQNWTKTAKQVHLADHMPSTGNPWPVIVRCAKDAVWYIHVPSTEDSIN